MLNYDSLGDETFGPARGAITAGARTINQEYEEARRKDVSNLQTNSYVS